MTDRELLKLAAKACCELTSKWYGNDAYFDGVLQRWNPLNDDGDALRLAVKLLFEIEMTQDCIAVRHSTGVKIFEAFNYDKYTATRRAIVRAAAEIGNRTKNELFELFKRRL